MKTNLNDLQLFDGGNVTLSQLSLTLTPEDDGKKLLCRTENPHLGPSSALEDSWLLDVYCEFHLSFLCVKLKELVKDFILKKWELKTYSTTISVN